MQKVVRGERTINIPVLDLPSTNNVMEGITLFITITFFQQFASCICSLIFSILFILVHLQNMSMVTLIICLHATV